MTTRTELRAGMRLTPGETLTSSSQRIRLELEGGALGLRDTADQEVRPSPARQPVTRLLMQRDGNLVAYGADRTRVWASNTGGNPGAKAVVSDDGTLAVRTAAGLDLWNSGTAMDWRTVKSTDEQGYHYDWTSDSWKQACEALPSFAAVAWPGYDTLVLEREIDGQPAVVQLWKGRCQRFLGLPDFPGGVGAEVGVYQRDPGRSVPKRLPFLPRFLELVVLAQLRLLPQADLWWAAPQLDTTLEFDFINPITNEPVFSADAAQTYWQNKWIYPEDYGRYGVAQGPARMPQSASHCILEFRINGGPPERWPADRQLMAGYDPAQLELMMATP